MGPGIFLLSAVTVAFNKVDILNYRSDVSCLEKLFHYLFSNFHVSDFIVHDDSLGFNNAYNSYRKLTSIGTEGYFNFGDQCRGR